MCSFPFPFQLKVGVRQWRIADLAGLTKMRGAGVAENLGKQYKILSANIFISLFYICFHQHPTKPPISLDLPRLEGVLPHFQI